MAVIVQVDFPYAGPFDQRMTEQMSDLAASINDEPGMLWKVWTINEQTKEAGGVYLFDNQANAEAYLAMHSARLQQMGVEGITGKVFHINEALTAINQGPVNPA